ncbi:MAG: amidase [Rhodobacteraceae bacterium]|uniref:amidase n=1 Tax=Marivita sp. TaxID=2003365 RepID=UPI003B51C0DD|nr:amidase [Paracoccaceae bacterium]
MIDPPVSIHRASGTDAISAWDRHIGAFVSLADGSADQLSGPLAGRTVAVKDIINVAGFPTKNGSRTQENTPVAAHDAPVVAHLRAAGAIVVGKTVTTEYAFTDPTPCRNPFGLEYSPGGSSSGSGAAVGAGVVDIALGTQTAGSLIRPAAYCGAVGFKPGCGVLEMEGVTPLSPSYDMVGVIARNLDFAADAFAVMTGDFAKSSAAPLRAGRVVLSDDAGLDADRLAAFEAGSEAVATYLGRVETLRPEFDLTQVVTDHRTVMCAEAAIAHANLLDDATQNLLMPNFREALLTGARITPDESASAKRRLADTAAEFWQHNADIDVIVTPPVPQGPPRLGTTTGYQHWLTVWTVLGGPLLCLPWGLDAKGLPISVMLAGRPGQDSGLLEFGQKIAAIAPHTPRPKLPSV